MTVLSFPTASNFPVASARPAAQPRLRITRRGRLVVTLLVALVVAAVALGLGLGAPTAEASGSAGAGSAASTLETYVVDGGQSLWDIAAEVAPQADPREFAAEVKKVNRLASSVLQPGQELLIPARFGD